MAEVDGVGPPEVTSTLAESEEEEAESPLEVPRPKRAQGQWELGYREPLTPQEQNKRNQDGLDVYDRIIHHYAVNGWDSIDPADLTGRFRWYGLYTQRPEEDKMFMMRVRVPGGQLSAEQLLAVAGIARRLGGGVVDVTDRQNFQFHNLRIEEVPEAWAMLAAVGLSTLETCGDVTRNVLGCPTAGIDASEYLDATPYVLAVSRRLTGTKEFSNLPRKYKISITGCTHRCGCDEVNDIGAVAHRVEGRAGFDVLVGGGLSTTPHMGQSLGAFVLPEELEEVCVGITQLFRDYGYRRTRNRARLKFLVADWGVAKVREVLERKYLRRPLLDGPEAPPSRAAHRDHVGIHRQKDGLLYVGFPLLAGRSDADQMAAIAELSRRHGKGRVRLTTQQKMVILDIPEARVEPLVDDLAGLGLQVRPSAFRRSTMACTGIEFCKLAVTETKGRAMDIVDQLEQRLPDFEDYVRINLNGCPNSCARFQIADIGFMGSIVTIAGVPTEVFQVYLGGHLGENRSFARLAKGARVRADRMTDYVEAMLRLYLDRRLPEQDFNGFLNQLSDPDLQEFARVAMPEGALVEAGTSEGGSAYAVRELTDEDTPFAKAAARRAGPT
ncbi:MAG TPA: nitrite/sulfite reductase [Candidatus Dormibacteraeota bacterium]|nr:nitrite/sulfite reductase [Candidatus Dormibacteraeota bacterium]